MTQHDDEQQPINVVICQSGSVGQSQMVHLMYPPIHVIHLAGYLRHYLPHANVSIVDGYAMGIRETIRAILSHQPDILFLHGDTPMATGMYEVINGIRDAASSDAKPATVMFGEHASALPSEPFTRSCCDAVMLGDPEPTAYAICRALMKGTSASEYLGDVSNLVYRTKGHEIAATPRTTRAQHLDELPPAARDLIDLSAYRGTFYKKSRSETSILAGRGCPWVCTYCGPAGRWALDVPVFRHRGAKSLVDELQSLQVTYGINDFLMIINVFNFNPNWSKEVCREIISRGLKVNIKTHVRADRLTPELLALMKEAGFWLVYIGVESANDRTLKGVKKELTTAQMEYALVEIDRAGIKTVAELMNCLFWEEDGRLVHEGLADAWRTLSFARRMFKRGLIHAMYWSAMMPLPASESYRIAVRHDLIPADVQGKWHLWFPVQRQIVRLPGITNVKWYAIQWLGKAHQMYFILSSKLLHPSRSGFVLKRACQLLWATTLSIFRGLRTVFRLRGDEA
jgi:radical SAM superfamily enzyme YgiQ (UPF0313 family)